MSARRWLGVGLVSVLVGGAGVGLWLALRETLPSGPVEVIWDREACAFCRMHVGQPAFAAQLQTTDGRVHNFDDVGCLFRFELERKPAVLAAYFHHHREKRWLKGPLVAFVPADPSPMGFNLGAVEPGTAASISHDEARRRSVADDAMKGGPR